MVFASFPRHLHRKLHDAGVIYHLWDGELDGTDEAEHVTCRMVCDWSLPEAEIDRFLSLL